MRVFGVAAFALVCAGIAGADDETADTSVSTVAYSIALETVLEHDDGEFLWFHPRATHVPSTDGAPGVLMTLQKHLRVSDFYSGLYTMWRSTPDGPWEGPIEVPELAWMPESDGVVAAVCDVTPGWHAPSGTVVAVGAWVRYATDGQQLEDKPRSHQTGYAVFDPSTRSWTPWRMIEMPDDERFNFARSGCAQWVTAPDGTLLLPFYIGRNAREDWSATVVRCALDGDTLRYVEHGSVLGFDGGRGLVEPSLIGFGGRYFLTLRNNDGAFVTVSDDGLRYEPIRPWRFDDGEELGSYNTQQHWLAHGDGLFLTYTRRGAGNDHIFRHRAPLFIAQVNPDDLRVIRVTERILIPERGATLGNFGASGITPQESWVTVAEGIWNDEARERGAAGAVFIAQVRWASPNVLAE